MKKTKATERNDKQATEYIRRLASGKFPELEVTLHYSESKTTDSEDCSLLMVKRYWRNVHRASTRGKRKGGRSR